MHLFKISQLFFVMLLGLTPLITASSLPTLPLLSTCHDIQSETSQSARRADDQFVSKKPQRRLTFPLISTSPRSKKLEQTPVKTKPKSNEIREAKRIKNLREYCASKEKVDTADRITLLTAKMKELEEQIAKEYTTYLEAYDKCKETLENGDLAAAAEPLTFEAFKENNGSWQEVQDNLEVLKNQTNPDL